MPRMPEKRTAWVLNRRISVAYSGFGTTLSPGPGIGSWHSAAVCLSRSVRGRSERGTQRRCGLARRHLAERDRVAANPLGRLAQGARHALDVSRIERDLACVQRAPLALGVDAADETAACEQRHRVVAVHALGRRRVRLDAVLEAEDARRALP